MPHNAPEEDAAMDVAVVDALRRALGDAVGEVRAVPVQETWIDLAPHALPDAVQVLQQDCDIWHLSTITGVDDGEGVLLLYHFWRGHGITLAMHLPYDGLEVPTLIDRIPGAAFYEREVAEMLGVGFAGHEGLEPLLLAEDWDDGPPLRKDTMLPGDDAQGGDA